MSVPDVVGCGWCPVVLPNDWVSWYAHFACEHKVDGGYSIRTIIQSDWDMKELADAR